LIGEDQAAAKIRDRSFEVQLPARLRLQRAAAQLQPNRVD
jgi:hypothetical protein